MYKDNSADDSSSFASSSSIEELSVASQNFHQSLIKQRENEEIKLLVNNTIKKERHHDKQIFKGIIQNILTKVENTEKRTKQLESKIE